MVLLIIVKCTHASLIPY